MKISKFSDAQISAFEKLAESGIPVADLYRQHAMSYASICKA